MGNLHRRAFTLVELLVVIGIIAVLVAILLPALNRARQQALEVECMSIARQWGAGLQMYVDQNKGQLPQKGPGGTNAGDDSFGPQSGIIGVNDPSLWFNAIPPLINNKSYYDLLVLSQTGNPLVSGHTGPAVPLPHAGDNSIFICPVQGPPGSEYLAPTGSDVIGGDYFSINGPSTKNVDSYGVLRVNGNTAQHTFNWAGTFVFNSKLTETIASSTALVQNPAIKMSSLVPTSDVVVMDEMIANYGEYKDPTVQAYANDPRINSLRTSGAAFTVDANGFSSNVAQPKACWTRFTTRHNHGGNILFADGHVSWFSWKDVQIPLDGSTNWSANQPSKLIWCPLGPTD
jgi:prepilin-type processing-associated H-X9-DG protein/prepilin-type N-terminal cleavage/methylation domain-containing protein